MKKIFSLMLVALALTNCSKDEEPVVPVVDQPKYTIYAVPDSRTANDGMNTKWVAGDEVNVFHAEAGSTEYVDDTPYTNGAGTPFVNTDAANGVFEGQLAAALDADKAYDWYMFYPYNSYTTTPANTDGGRSYIGSRSDHAQTQTGNNSMAHIAGTNYPLYGKATNVAAAATPSITMKHASSLVEFKVVNGTSEAFAVTGIDFTSTEDIVGNYYIDFSEATPSFKKYSTYTSALAQLAVAEGAEIAAGGSATFYMAIKPHTVNGDINIVVKTTKGNCEKTITGQTPTFTAGKMKTITVNVASFKTFVDYSGTYVIMNTQKDNGSYFYMSNLSNNASGTNRKAVDTGLTNIPASLNSIPSMCNAARWIIAKVDDEQAFTIQSADNLKYISGANEDNNYAKLTDNIAAAEKVTIDYDDESETYTITSITVPAKTLTLNSSNTIFAFYAAGQRDALRLIPATEALLDMSVAEDVALTADAANGTVDVDLANNEGWTVAVSNNSGGWLTTNAALNGSNQVVYSATANTGDAREATVTLTATKATDSKVITFTVSQDKKAAAGAKELTFNFTSAPTGWPSGSSQTNNTSEAGTYAYTIDGQTYNFTHTKNGTKGIFFHTSGSYLMICQGEVLGLPAIDGYKLTKVVASNGGSSVSLKVGISSSVSSYVSDEEQQLWDTKNIDYTFNLTNTTANTVYYLYPSANCQLKKLVLSYAPAQ